ncbi:head GIN domain-containing protein [Methanolapillus ohkumae]|uniref:Putative auto-transporter adhesin head GIN domain-containing protein n=1 Tax=Methanolapillus ohkumae TaxID=3028298 RepID=A0AA96ZVJ0_9EURY|nr:hypothetical protein MsAm2_06830 [Methanosarcinaceae archaeon Am2]
MKLNLNLKLFPLWISLFTLVLFFAATGCIDGNEKVITNETLGTFNKINISGNADIDLIPSGMPAIRFEIEQKYIGYIQYEIINDTLEIKIDEKMPPGKDVELTIGYQNLDELNLAGKNKIETNDPIQSENLTITAAGVNDIDVDVFVTNFTFNVSGTTQADISGTAKSANIKANGTSDVDLENLTTADMVIGLNGISNAEIYVTNSLNAVLTGTCKLTYAGNPTTVTDNVATTSILINKNDR